MKKHLHPKWYENCIVYCNGKPIMKIGSTKPELHVEVWSGIHPFYTGYQKQLDTEGRIEKFMRKYGM
nr:ribosomal protein L31 [Cyanidioschyzonaceae sp. 2]